MLKYKYINEMDGELVFSYYPEGNEDAPGKVAITANGAGRIIEVSKKDFGNRYALHAIKGIDISSKSGTVAWY